MISARGPQEPVGASLALRDRGSRDLRSNRPKVRMKTVTHAQAERCPRCGHPAFCDNCGVCVACHFTAPEVDLPHPPPPQPKLRCRECREASAHARTCSATRRAAAN